MGNSLGNNQLASSPPSIFTSRQPSLLPNLSRAPHSVTIPLIHIINYGIFECISVVAGRGLGIYSSKHFAGSASGPQPVFGASPMGLLPGGEKLGLLPTSGISNGEKKPPLLSHKLTGAEITAVRQLITGYR